MRSEAKNERSRPGGAAVPSAEAVSVSDVLGASKRHRTVQEALLVIIGALAMTATFPGRTHGLGMIAEPMLTELGLANDEGRLHFANVNFWGTMLGALFCLPMGWMLDRFDIRWIYAGNMVLLGATVVLMSQLTSFPAIAAMIMLSRGFGQSALSVVSITLVAKSFSSARIGLAMAWYAILAAPFHLGLIEGVRWGFKEEWSWRTIWGCVGVSLIGLALTAAIIPRPFQLLDEEPGREASGEKPGMTLAEALRTPAFWVISLTISLWGMIYAGVALFNEDIFRERGFSKDLYLQVLQGVTVIAIFAKLGFGYLCRYVSATRLLAVALCVTSLCLLGFPFASQAWLAWLYAVGLGIASGAVALLFFAAWGRLFGQKELGRIQGVAQMMTVFASAAGPILFSLGKSLSHSYSMVFWTLSAMVLGLAIAAAVTPRPKSMPTPS